MFEEELKTVYEDIKNWSGSKLKFSIEEGLLLLAPVSEDQRVLALVAAYDKACNRERLGLMVVQLDMVALMMEITVEPPRGEIK